MEALPEKCCANCGFLFGLTRFPASREDIIFDPDIIRSIDYRQSHPSDETATENITSFPYSVQLFTYSQNKTNEQTSDLSEIRNLHWGDAASICCYMREFVPIPAHSTANQITLEKLQNYRNSLPLYFDSIKYAIQKEREDCKNYFAYHPGLSPKQHFEFRLEETKILRQENHEKMLAQWSAEQEKRLVEWTTNQEARWRKFEANREDNWKKIEIRLYVMGFIFIVLQILVDVIVANQNITP